MLSGIFFIGNIEYLWDSVMYLRMMHVIGNLYLRS